MAESLSGGRSRVHHHRGSGECRDLIVPCYRFARTNAAKRPLEGASAPQPAVLRAEQARSPEVRSRADSCACTAEEHSPACSQIPPTSPPVPPRPPHPAPTSELE